MVDQTRIDLFMSKVVPEPNSGCWIWIGSSNKQGYGNFWHNGKCHKAHRFSYRAFVGPLPDNRDLLHGCDIPYCVNPDHLSPGTALDNVRDMWRKGRGVRSRGAANGNSRLTEDGVQRIRDLSWLGYERTEIGRRLGVSRSAVGRILNGQNWKVSNG